MVTGLLLTANAKAALIDRGNGLIYDTDLDITWLQDANYAMTSGYDADGRMTWDESIEWVSQLSYGGHNDWRLPTIDGLGQQDYDLSYDNGVYGFNVNTETSELAHLYFDELGNASYYDRAGELQSSYGLENTGLFINFESWDYWTNEEFYLNTDYIWLFDFYSGYQFMHFRTDSYFSMAVADGDIGAVPVPASVWLFGSGLIGLIGFAKGVLKYDLHTQNYKIQKT